MSADASSPVASPDTGSAAVRRRLLAASAFYLLIVLAVAWGAEMSRQKVSAEVEHLVIASNEQLEVADFKSGVAELQRSVLVFRLTGNAAVAERIERHYGALVERYDDLDRLFDDKGYVASRGTLRRMRGHLENYYENFTTLVDHLRRREAIIVETRESLEPRVTALLEQTAVSGESPEVLSGVRQAVDSQFRSMAEFLRDPYTDTREALRDEWRSALDAAGELEFGPADGGNALKEALAEYDRNYQLIVQLKRGDLYLANVVLAGSASELLRLADELVALSAERLAASKSLADENIRKARRIDAAVLFLSAAFAVGLIAIVSRGLTRLSRLEDDIRDSEEKFRVTFDQAAVGIAHVDLDGGFIRVNRRLSRILGYTPEELLQLTFQEITHPDDLDADLENLEQLLDGKVRSYSMEKRYLTRSGDPLWAELTVSLVRDDNGGPKYFISVIEDITQRKQDQAILQSSRESLARSNTDLQQFAYVASHDLQEPLRMVSSYLQLLERRYKGKLDEDADEFIHYAVDGAQRMKTLVNDLLSLSRVDSRGEALVPTDFGSVMRNALLNLKIAIEENAAVVEYEALPMVTGDAVQLEQLLQNLIGNAIKYRRDDAPVVHVTAERITDSDLDAQDLELADGWVIGVHDNGIGIDFQYAEEVFGIFRRLHGKDEYGGTGIGLAVCRKIVERHGGRIWVDTSQAVGSSFYFTLQAAVEAAEPGHADEAAA